MRKQRWRKLTRQENDKIQKVHLEIQTRISVKEREKTSTEQVVRTGAVLDRLVCSKHCLIIALFLSALLVH